LSPERKRTHHNSTLALRHDVSSPFADFPDCTSRAVWVRFIVPYSSAAVKRFSEHFMQSFAFRLEFVFFPRADGRFFPLPQNKKEEVPVCHSFLLR
jgi:hypothetical protein